MKILEITPKFTCEYNLPRWMWFGFKVQKMLDPKLTLNEWFKNLPEKARKENEMPKYLLWADSLRGNNYDAVLIDK